MRGDIGHDGAEVILEPAVLADIDPDIDGLPFPASISIVLEGEELDLVTVCPSCPRSGMRTCILRDRRATSKSEAFSDSGAARRLRRCMCGVRGHRLSPRVVPIPPRPTPTPSPFRPPPSPMATCAARRAPDLGAESARVPALDVAAGACASSLDRITAVVRRQTGAQDPADDGARVLLVDPGPVHGTPRCRSREALSHLVPLPGDPGHLGVGRAGGGGGDAPAERRGAEVSQKRCSCWRWRCSRPRPMPSPRPFTPRIS